MHVLSSIPNQIAGYAVGGGHVLHMVCDLTIAADNAIFGQTGVKVLIYLSYLILLVFIFIFNLKRCARIDRTYQGLQETGH